VSHERHLCADPECVTDALQRLEKELRDGERLWLVEQSKEGRWTASAVTERWTRGRRRDESEVELRNVGYGSGNNMYQALAALRINVKLRHVQQDEKHRGE
jgi:hypothetical protein